MSDDPFADLVRRVRAGDEDAAAQLVREYEPHIRRAVRVRMTDPSLRRIVDSMDVCQSVLANFFVRTAAGQFDLDTPQELVSLLVTMATNRVVDWHRRSNSIKGDRRREVSLCELGSESAPYLSRDPSPSRRVAARELLVRVYAGLSEDERRLAEARATGASWQEIAAREQRSPDALRMRLHRGLDRVMQQVGASDVC